jgi:uncharacterized protein
MSTLDLDQNRSLFQIKAYQPGRIQINNELLQESIIISPQQLIKNWAPRSIDQLTSSDLDLVIPFKPNVLLIGTGEKMVILSIEIYGSLINQGIGVEIMNTSAACRTFNALSAEDRKVVAALIV